MTIDDDQLNKGYILLSSNELEDPNFNVTVILVCIHNKDGAFGLVCNRLANMPLGEMFDISYEYRKNSRCVYIGGPVDQDAINIIQITNTPSANSYEISENVYLGGEWGSIEDIIKENPSTTRVFLGYSGWAAGQLEEEIKEGSWNIFNVDMEKFLKNWETPLYHDINEIYSYLKSISGDNVSQDFS